MSSNIPQPPSASAASWRDLLPVHPAANLFPVMSPDELRALGEDIRKHGLQMPITVMREVGDTGEPLYYLADGRNRLDAIELAGFNTIAIKRSRGRAHRRREGMECGLDLFLGLPDRLEVAINYISPPDDTYAFVVSANIHRRHLTAEQKRELIAKLLKSTPEQSDRQIAETVKVDHKTVGAVRAEQEGRGEIPHVETRTDAKGRKQPAKKPSAKPASPPPPPEVRETIPQLIDGLKAEGRKNMATMSPGTVARLAALLERKLEEPKARDDIGADSRGERERLAAENEELRAAKRRLEIENEGLRSEIDELKAELAKRAPAAADGLDVPEFLRRAAPAQGRTS